MLNVLWVARTDEILREWNFALNSLEGPSVPNRSRMRIKREVAPEKGEILRLCQNKDVVVLNYGKRKKGTAESLAREIKEAHPSIAVGIVNLDGGTESIVSTNGTSKNVTFEIQRNPFYMSEISTLAKDISRLAASSQ